MRCIDPAASAEAAATHRIQYRRLVELTEGDGPEPPEADPLRDEMDLSWYAMNDEDQEAFRAWAGENVARIEAEWRARREGGGAGREEGYTP